MALHSLSICMRERNDLLIEGHCVFVLVEHVILCGVNLSETQQNIEIIISYFVTRICSLCLTKINPLIQKYTPALWCTVKLLHLRACQTILVTLCNLHIGAGQGRNLTSEIAIARKVHMFTLLWSNWHNNFIWCQTVVIAQTSFWLVTELWKKNAVAWCVFK